MEVISNVDKLLGDDLKQTLKKSTKVSVAASCFSIYAYEALKKELEQIDEMRFIFTSPTFIADSFKKEKREFYIPKLNRERSLYGTEFEIKLKNELTQKAIAKECSDWIRKKATFKSNKTSGALQGMVNIEREDESLTYMPINGFTTVDLGYERGNALSNMVNKFTDYRFSKTYIDLFDQVWRDKSELEDVTADVIDHSIFQRAQKAFSKWSGLPADQRTTQSLLDMLDFDFFELLDSLTIARSRKHIQKYYRTEEIGDFPQRNVPISKFCDLTDRKDVIGYNDIFRELSRLNLGIYAPFDYILPSRRKFYEDTYDTVVASGSLKQSDRERSLQKLMRINLLKRLESSVEAFRITLSKIVARLDRTLKSVADYERTQKESPVEFTEMEDPNFDDDEWLDDEFSIGDTIKISLSDMDILRWKEDLTSDRNILRALLEEMKKITPEHDKKLQTLKGVINDKIKHPINDGNRKILIFTAFTDTAAYLYDRLSPYVKERYNMETAKVVGSDENKNTAGLRNDISTLLTCFSPKSKEKALTMPHVEGELDLLIASDCISEGQNLQDCDYMVNYDIHWNPVRVIQRFGRIDRIGSSNAVIQMVNFWPNMTLDEYIRLKERVENRMIIMDMTGTGEDNVLSNESSDLEYRKQQLKKLQQEVVDLDDMNTGVSITDLGLNDFRMDLVNYVNENGDLDTVPFGMHTVVKSDPEKGIIPGVIFVLRNVNAEVNINNQNRLHPFYLVYISEDAEVIIDHLNVKKTMDFLRALCKGKSEPVKEACDRFNQETDDGKKMDKYSMLLEETIKSMIHVKEESDLDSLFSSGGTTALTDTIQGLEDFELIAFVVIR